MRILFALLAMASGLFAQTVVTDTIYTAVGVHATGYFILTPNRAFTTPGGVVVSANPIYVALNASTGVFSVSLYPNTTATLQPSFYTARWFLNGVPSFSTQWIVPVSATPVNLATVQGPNPALIQPSQIDASLAHNGDCLTFNGSTVGWRSCSGLGTLTGVIYSTVGVPSAVTGIATDCVKVNGTSGTCGSASTALQGLGTVTTTMAIDGGNLTTKTISATLGGNVTCSTPANFTTGEFLLLSLTQDGTGSRPFTCANLIQLGDNSQIPAGKNTKQVFIAVSSTTLNAWTGMWCVDCPGEIYFPAVTAPATPASGFGKVYLDSTSKNLAVKDDAGVIKHGVQTKAVVANQFLTGCNDAGVCTGTQPTDADLSTSNVTTNNVTTAKHGFAPILPNDATKYLDGTGAYSVPAGGGLSITTSGAGKLCIPSCGPGNTAGTTFNTKAPVYQQFVLPWTQKFSVAGIFPSTAPGSACAGSNPCGIAAAVYDSTCTKVASTDITTLTGATSAAVLLTFATPQTLAPGVYYWGMATDSAVMALYGPTDNAAFVGVDNVAGSGGPRHFRGATAATGDNGGLTMPASCGARTALSANPEEIAVFFP